MNAGVLLAAGNINVVAIGIVIVFIVIPLIGVVASKLSELAQPARPAAPAERNNSGRIQEQIDDFLRREAQRRGGQPAVVERQPVEVIVEDDAPVGNRMGQQSQKYMDTSDFRRRSDEMGGELVQAEGQFNQQVRKAFSGEVSHLAARPGEAATPMEVMEEAAQPDYASRPTLDALPEAGSGLAALLGSPENIVQAVIMSEILRRPE